MIYKVTTYIKLQDGSGYTDVASMSKDELINFLEANIHFINSNYHIVISADDYTKQELLLQ
jgi:hypothetical protein